MNTTKKTHVLINGAMDAFPAAGLCGRKPVDGDVPIFDYPEFDRGQRPLPLGAKLCETCRRILASYTTPSDGPADRLFIESQSRRVSRRDHN